MAMSKAEMFNLALRYLGIVNETITDPDDSTNPHAVQFSTWWDAYVPKELEGHDWQFARGSIAMTQSGTYTTSPYPGLSYIYTWPTDCLSPLFIPGESGRDNIPYRIGVQGDLGSRKKLIYTSRDEAVLVYTADMTQDYSLFPYTFGVMLAGRLALEYGFIKFGVGKQLEGLKELFRFLVVEARNEDAGNIMEDHWDVMHTSRYVTARGDSTAAATPSTFTQES
jgi:hypothetical protein